MLSLPCVVLLVCDDVRKIARKPRSLALGEHELHSL
jgi:hypothetical protein